MTYEQFARMLTLMGPSDLWTVERAARHWGVSASRARAILSSRHIHRVSGYPAQAIKAVTLRQGARTDLKTANHLVPAAQAFTMAETGAAIGETEDERARLRIFFEFLRGADETGTSALDLIVDEPALIGEHRFDALLAAAAEYISARWGRPGPLWSVSIERFLDTAWWVSDLPSARAFAAVWTPAPFRRRGIYLDRHDLTSDGVCVMPEPVFNRTELQRAFTALAAKLERRGVVGQVHVVGGAAMLLAYNSRVTTRDIDALFSTDGPMLEAIREVADEMGWPRTWLNNQASGYVSRTPGEGAPVFDHPFLHVVATPAQHLLAMKVVAARGVRDGEDIRLLLDRLRITSAAGVWEIVARYFPAETITDRSRLLVEDIDVDFWGVVNGTKAFLPHVIASGDGHIVNISSLFGLIAVPGQSAYNAAKFAVRGFTEALRQEMLVARHPVKVTCVHPGGIKTAVARNATVADGEDQQTFAEFFDRRLALHSPEMAAKTIVNGVAKGQARVVVGLEAKAVDVLARIMGSSYQRLVAAGVAKFFPWAK